MTGTQIVYPEVRRDETVVDDYHGSKICDPYRWLEDPDSDETRQFVKDQNNVTMPFLKNCATREKLRERITEMWNYPKYSCPTKNGPKYFYYHNTGLQNQSVLYVQDSPESDASVFLDPNTLSSDGTTSIRGSAFSEDGSLFAYGLSYAGSDWVTIKFRDVATRADLDDVLTHVKFSSMAWTHDNVGFFYNRYPESDGKSDGTETTTNFHQKVFYHKLGTSQSEDVLCAEWPDHPKWITGVEVSDCGRYLIAVIHEGCEPVNRFYYCDLHALPDGITGLLPFVKIVDNFEAVYEYITNDGPVFTLKTNLKAPKYKLINIDITKPSAVDWTDLVAEHESDVLDWGACVHDNRLVLCYLHDVKSVLHLHDLGSGGHVMTFPLDIGSVVGYSGKKKDTEIFYQFVSFLTPGLIFRCDLTQETLKPTIFRETEVKGLRSGDFETKQKFFESADGTKVPMFIVHKKGLKLDGSHPVLLYGYGGFNISVSPTFSISRIVFMNHLGGVLAVPNLRGGGEYGDKWYKAGILANKQRGLDDFISAARFLIDSKYTVPQKISVNGGSNGGLLVAACINQHPELFGCAIAQVGVLDVLRFHKFTIGHAWTSDYGCSEKSEEFDWIIRYSPLHNIRAASESRGQYPAVMLLTADHDDRVVPLHSFKFIAQLQRTAGACAAQKNPLLIRIDTKSGHGAGKPTSKTIDELADIYGFLAHSLDLSWCD